MPTDLLADPGWLREHHIDESDLAPAHGPPATHCRRWSAASGPVGPLQPFLDGVALTPTTTEDGIDWQFAALDAAARAVLAWDTLRISSRGRLRPCANDECHLFLLDRSKPNTALGGARWRSAATGMKARRHYRRTHSD